MEESKSFLSAAGQPAARFRSLWDSLSRTTRLALVIAAVAAAAGLALLFSSGIGSPPMEVLFSGLDPRQASAVAAALEEQKIAYTAGDGGRSILVPRDQRDRLRLKLSPDLYAQSKGFALFETTGLMVSDFERRVQWQMALEEELRRTITSLDAVQQARVHLVVPEGGVFLRDKGQPSAAVFLRLAPLASLGEAQIRGILTLVAGSVEGLLPEHVTIIDSQGNVLFDAFHLQAAAAPQAATRHLEMQRGFEKELEYRLRAMLERIYGPGKAVVMASAELDFDTREKTTVTFENPVNRSRQRSEEHYQGTAAPPEEAGEPNIPGYAAGAGHGEYQYRRVDEIINYEVGETREYIASAPGQIKRLSAAVILDLPAGADADTEDHVAALVASAIGLQGDRGDTVTVQFKPFDTSWREGWQEEPLPPLEQPAFRVPHYAFAAGAAALVVLLAVLLVLRGRTVHRREEQIIRQGLSREVLPEEPPAVSEDKKKYDHIRQMAEEHPENMAQLLRTWLVKE